jgi:tetraacyldisaccharide 4'-kinase
LLHKKLVLNKETFGDKLTIGLQTAWYKRGLLSFLIAALLWPLSQVYKFLAFTHCQLYQFGILKAQRVSIPVVVVGNIVAGGGGKTPTVIALVQHLQAQGIQVGLISRGYGRANSACLEVKRDSKTADVGDEPLSILLSLDLLACNAPLFVAKSRFEAATALIKAYPQTQVILADDGLQHHALQHDIAITVFDDRGLGNGLLLPAGPLRESAVKTFNSLVLHTGNQAVKLANTTAPQFTAHRALASYALRADGSKVQLADLNQQCKLLALAGIANPEAFFDMLRNAGLNLTQTLPLPDHYDFQYAFNSNLGNKYADYTLICTLKDAVKLWQTQPHALAVPLEFSPEAAFFTAFDGMLKPFLKTHPPT